MKFRKFLACLLTAFVLSGLPGVPADAAETLAVDDPVRLEDMVVTLLVPFVGEAVNSFYAPYLSVSPTVATYYGTKIVRIDGGERIWEGIGNSRYTVTLEVLPYVGPHQAVGRDRITLNVTPEGVAVENYEHLESYELTPNYRSLIKNPLP